MGVGECVGQDILASSFVAGDVVATGTSLCETVVGADVGPGTGVLVSVLVVDGAVDVCLDGCDVLTSGDGAVHGDGEVHG